MNILRAILQAVGIIEKASQADDDDEKAVAAARQAGKTAGQVAAEAEEAARGARMRLARCRSCGGTGYLRGAHSRSIGSDGTNYLRGAVCPRCHGTGNDPGPPTGAAVVAGMVLAAFTVGLPPRALAEPMPPPIYCEPMLAAADPADVGGLQRVLDCERITSAYKLDLAALALRSAQEKLAAVPDPPSRVEWLLYGAGVVATVWLGVRVGAAVKGRQK